MIYFQPCTVRILKQHRVVTRCKTVLLRSVNNVRADFFQEIMHLVDIGSLTRAKTVVMQSDRALPESLARIFRRRCMNSETRAAADTIESVDGIGHDRKTEKRQQLRIECAGGRKISGRNKRMGDTVYFHR